VISPAEPECDYRHSYLLAYGSQLRRIGVTLSEAPQTRREPNT